LEREPYGAVIRLSTRITPWTHSTTEYKSQP